MFKNSRALNASAGLVALLFIVFISATCSSGGGGGGDDHKSSSSSYTKPEEKEDPSVHIDVRLDISYDGMLDRVNVDFDANVAITGGDDVESKFDRAILILNGQEIENASGQPGFIVNKPFSVSNVSCGGKIEVCYELYAREAVKAACKETVRNEEFCRSSSSLEEPSSSSTPPKTFNASFSGNTKTLDGNGLNLSTGESANPHISFNQSAGVITARGGAEITNCFDDDGICKNISTIAIANPSTTADFMPRNIWEASVDYARNRYYIVKTGGTEWGPGWFLITSATVADSDEIDIKVWTVN